MGSMVGCKAQLVTGLYVQLMSLPEGCRDPRLQLTAAVLKLAAEQAHGYKSVMTLAASAAKLTGLPEAAVRLLHAGELWHSAEAAEQLRSGRSGPEP